MIFRIKTNLNKTHGSNGLKNKIIKNIYYQITIQINDETNEIGSPNYVPPHLHEVIKNEIRYIILMGYKFQNDFF